MQILQPVWRRPPAGPLSLTRQPQSVLSPRQAVSPEGGVGSKAAENR